MRKFTVQLVPTRLVGFSNTIPVEAESFEQSEGFHNFVIEEEGGRINFVASIDSSIIDAITSVEIEPKPTNNDEPVF